MVGLFVMLSGFLMMGLALLCIISHISPWIWAIPLLATYILGLVLALRRGDRVIVAVPRRDDSHALLNDT